MVFLLVLLGLGAAVRSAIGRCAGEGIDAGGGDAGGAASGRGAPVHGLSE